MSDMKEGVLHAYRTSLWRDAKVQDTTFETVSIDGRDHQLQMASSSQVHTLWRAKAEAIEGQLNLRPPKISANTLSIHGAAAFNVFSALPISSGRHAFEFIAYSGVKSCKLLSCGLSQHRFDPADPCVGEGPPRLETGTRVMRGRDWRYDNQDGGPGRHGTVIEVNEREMTVIVKWDSNGDKYRYRNGQSNLYDLKPEASADVSEQKRVWGFIASNSGPHPLRLAVPEKDQDGKETIQDIKCDTTSGVVALGVIVDLSERRLSFFLVIRVMR